MVALITNTNSKALLLLVALLASLSLVAIADAASTIIDRELTSAEETTRRARRRVKGGNNNSSSTRRLDKGGSKSGPTCKGDEFELTVPIIEFSGSKSAKDSGAVCKKGVDTSEESLTVIFEGVMDLDPDVDRNPSGTGPCSLEIAICKNLALYGVLESVCPCSETMVIPEKGDNAGNEVNACSTDGPTGVGDAAAAASYCKYELGIGTDIDLSSDADTWPDDLLGCRFTINRCCCIRLQDCSVNRPKCPARFGSCKAVAKRR